MQANPAPPKRVRLASFMRGARLAIPITLGYIPVGFTFGVLAQKAGFSAFESGLMCFLVFAGSSQLIAVNLLLLGIPPINIITTTFVVNARHLLMSAAMSPFLGCWSKKKQLLYAAEMTDETFALNITRFDAQSAKCGMSVEVDEAEAFGVHTVSHTAWVLGGVLGGVFGGMIADLKPYGLDFALSGMFIALLVPHLKIPRHLAAALVSGVLSIILYMGGIEQWNVLIATATGATVCLVLPMPGKEEKE